jgi:hypothetical protein
MAIDFAKAVGHKLGYLDVRSTYIRMDGKPLVDHTHQVSWNRRDLLAYAIGVGAKASDLSFVYGMFFGHLFA